MDLQCLFKSYKKCLAINSEKADFSKAKISKTEHFTPKQYRWMNRATNKKGK